MKKLGDMTLGAGKLLGGAIELGKRMKDSTVAAVTNPENQAKVKTQLKKGQDLVVAKGHRIADEITDPQNRTKAMEMLKNGRDALVGTINKKEVKKTSEGEVESTLQNQMSKTANPCRPE
jgi:hypothetical protein